MAAFRATLALRGLTLQEVAKRIGLTRGSFYNRLSLGLPDKHLRERIESVLKTPIWSNPEEFQPSRGRTGKKRTTKVKR
jgi:transcriptional regulator with XRE-family HTH domain